MSKFLFKVTTYSYDGSGYYISYSDQMDVEITALTSAEAKRKAIALREGDSMRGNHDKWGAKVISATEVREEDKR